MFEIKPFTLFLLGPFVCATAKKASDQNSSFIILNQTVYNKRNFEFL